VALVAADLPGRRSSPGAQDTGIRRLLPVGRPGPASLQCRPANRRFEGYRDRRFVGYLVTRGVVSLRCQLCENSRAKLRCDYEDYLRRQRGLSERTIGHCWRFADRFLDFRFDDAEIDLGAITGRANSDSLEQNMPVFKTDKFYEVCTNICATKIYDAVQSRKVLCGY
jgi:hypothetical protein